MLKYIRENIDNAQEQAKQKIGLMLGNMDYQIVTDLHNKEGIETRIYQWTNTLTNHCIQLIWDGKEDWFDLGEFQYSDNLNYLNANQIILVPIKIEKIFYRKKYISSKIDDLILAIKRKYN